MTSRSFRMTGAAWLPEIPAEWSIVPAKALFANRNELSGARDVHLTPSQKFGVVSQEEYMQLSGSSVVLNLTGADRMKHVEPGDFVSHLRSFQGGLERSSLAGKVSAAYTVLAPRGSVFGPYFAYLLKCDRYVQALRVTTDQLRDGQSIRYKEFGQIPLPLPTFGEQQTIADFLDREIAQIDGLIEAQSELVAQLEERRLSLVGQAVFGALHGGETAESGVSWLPATPLAWPITQLGFVCETLPGYAFPSDAFETEPGATPLLRGVNVKPGRIDWSETVYWDEDQSPIPNAYRLSRGDLVFGMDRPFIGSGVRVAAVTEEDLPALLLQRVLRIRPTDLSDRSYLRYLFETPALLMYLEPMFTGISVPHVSEWQVRKFQMPLPPIKEQVEIAAHLDDQTARMRSLIDAANEAIVLMQERRSALISAAVTGQIDPRTGNEAVLSKVLEFE